MPLTVIISDPDLWGTAFKSWVAYRLLSNANETLPQHHQLRPVSGRARLSTARPQARDVYVIGTTPRHRHLRGPGSSTIVVAPGGTPIVGASCDVFLSSGHWFVAAL